MNAEALRQQALLQSLWRVADQPLVTHVPQAQGCARLAAAAGAVRGLQAYQASAGALAERALAAAYPTVQQLLGADSFAGLARTLWAQQPPQQGDMALWGAGLASFISTAAALASEPYLADVAKLEWAVHLAHTSADSSSAPDLEALATEDPAGLWLHTRPGTALVSSPHPVLSIWLAHQAADSTEPATEASDNQRYAAVQAAFAKQRPEHALVHRSGWRVQVLPLPAQHAAFTMAVLAAVPLGAALDQAGAGFDFEAWLVAALQAGWLVAAKRSPP
jgi:hypothetical protein